MLRDPFVQSWGVVDGQRQPVTVHHFAHPVFRPKAQPMLAGFAGRVRVDDVGASSGLGRVLGQSIGRIDALEHALQVGVRERQGSQLTIAQRHQLHRSNKEGIPLHAGIIRHGAQVIDVDGAFKFSPHQDGDVGIQGGSELDLQTHVAGLLGIELGAIRVPARHVVPHEQGTILLVAPLVRFDHELTMFGHGPSGFQETIIPQSILRGRVAHEFQGHVRVLFPLDKLSHGCHPFALEGKRVLFLGPIEGRAVQDPHDHALRHFAQEQVILLPRGRGPVEGEGANLIPHHRVLDHLLSELACPFQGRVDIRVETQSAQVKGDVHILFSQLHVPLDAGATGQRPKGVEIGTVEVQLKIHFHPGHHHLAHVEGGQVRSHDQTDHGIVPERGRQGLEQVIVIVQVPSRATDVVVGAPSGQRWGHVQEIDPALRLQHRHPSSSIVAVVVEQRLEIGRVGVRVGLFGHQGAIEPQVDLLEEGVGQVVDGVHEPSVVGIRGGIGIGRDAVGGRRVQPRVNDEITAIQIRVIFQLLHRELHGRDAAAQFVVGNHLKALEIVVGRRDRENVQIATHDAEGEEKDCISSSASSSFYILGQVVPRRFGDVRTDPSSSLGATLPGQQPFGQVVARGFADARTDPSSSLSPKRRRHAPLITRPRLDHQPSWTDHLLHAQHVADASHGVPIPFFGGGCRRSLGHRSGNGKGLAFHPSFYLFTHGSCHPAPRLSSGSRPCPGLHGTGQNGSAQTIQILSKSSSILRRQGWWTIPRQTASPHDLTRSPGTRAFFIRRVGRRR